jgi:predicted transcriptional regulator
MKTIVAKLDDDTFRQLEELARDQSRSEVVRTAIREFIAKQRIERRRREVEEYMRTSGESKMMREIAEDNMDHAAELLARAESET